MARRKLTPEQQLKGVQAAIRSPRTPPQLKDGLRRREEVLQKIMDAPRSNASGSARACYRGADEVTCSIRADPSVQPTNLELFFRTRRAA